MCYPKPGPRCSKHSYDRYRKAVKKLVRMEEKIASLLWDSDPVDNKAIWGSKEKKVKAHSRKRMADRMRRYYNGDSAYIDQREWDALKTGRASTGDSPDTVLPAGAEEVSVQGLTSSGESCTVEVQENTGSVLLRLKG